MKKVWVSPELTTVHLVQAELEAAGIRAEVVGNAVGQDALLLPELWPSLWVADEAQLEVALPLVRDFERRQLREAGDASPTMGPSWRCPSCGEEVEPQFAVCWQCCADRPA